MIQFCNRRTREQCDNIFSFKLIDWFAVYEFEPYETHVPIELLDTQLAFVMLVPYHLYKFLIPGCEDVCCSFLHGSSAEFTDYSAQFFISASHILVVRDILEFHGSVYIEHKPSSFEMKVRSSG